VAGAVLRARPGRMFSATPGPLLTMIKGLPPGLTTKISRRQGSPLRCAVPPTTEDCLEAMAFDRGGISFRLRAAWSAPCGRFHPMPPMWAEYLVARGCVPGGLPSCVGGVVKTLPGEGVLAARPAPRSAGQRRIPAFAADPPTPPSPAARWWRPVASEGGTRDLPR